MLAELEQRPSIGNDLYGRAQSLPEHSVLEEGEKKGVEGSGKKDHDFFPHTQIPLAKSHQWLRVSLLWTEN